jgi:hypothetical protein
MKIHLLITYILLILVGMVAFYSIFNVGNPNSLLRFVIETDGYDLYIAMGSSLTVFFLGFFVFYFRQSQGYEELLQVNRKRIKELRKKGYKDEKIAEDLLSALGFKEGYRYRLIKKRLVLELSSIDVRKKEA